MTDRRVLPSFPPGITVMIQGASRGIGLEFCRQLLADEQCSQVIATCRDPGAATTLQSLACGGERLVTLQLDLRDEASIAAAADAARARCAELDIIVNCAGVLHEGSRFVPERRLAEVDPEALLWSFRTNAAGPLLVAKHFASLMPRARRAVFASISARVGSIGDNRLGGWYAYRAAKAAQNMFTKTLSIELARRHRQLICVALHPGTTDTDLSRPFQKNVPEGKLFEVSRSVGHLLEVIDSLDPGDTGSFYAWDGQPIPW